MEQIFLDAVEVAEVEGRRQGDEGEEGQQPRSAQHVVCCCCFWVGCWVLMVWCCGVRETIGKSDSGQGKCRVWCVWAGGPDRRGVTDKSFVNQGGERASERQGCAAMASVRTETRGGGCGGCGGCGGSGDGGDSKQAQPSTEEGAAS